MAGGFWDDGLISIGDPHRLWLMNHIFPFLRKGNFSSAGGGPPEGK